MFWIDQSQASPDTHVAFCGSFATSQAQVVEIRLLAASWYALWFDGEYICDGPSRFVIDYPEYDKLYLNVPTGKHVIAMHVHYQGVQTRILPDVDPFVFCVVISNGLQLQVKWKCSVLPGYRQQTRRLSPLFGWIEWCDTRVNPMDWQTVSFDDTSWVEPVETHSVAIPKHPVDIGPVQQFRHQLHPIAGGAWAERFGYELDDPPTRFFLRDLVCTNLPASGVWRRYDLGRVRLGRLRFTLDVPPGTMAWPD